MSTGSKGRHQHQCELPAQREHSVGAVRGSQRFVVREEFSATLHTLCPAGSEAATPASSLPLTLFAFLYIGLYFQRLLLCMLCAVFCVAGTWKATWPPLTVLFQHPKSYGLKGALPQSILASELRSHCILVNVDMACI